MAIVYISGPITNDPDYSENFRLAEDALRDLNLARKDFAE